DCTQVIASWNHHESAIWHGLNQKPYVGKQWILVADNREHWHSRALERDQHTVGRLRTDGASSKRGKCMHVRVSISNAVWITCTTRRKLAKEARRRVRDGGDVVGLERCSDRFTKLRIPRTETQSSPARDDRIEPFRMVC